MTLNFNKYRKRYAVAILAAYLLLVSISILHYHQVDIQTGNYEINSDSKSACNDPFDKLVDITHECAIQHFTDTVINYNFITIFNITKETGEQNISLKEILPLPQAPLYNDNRFRAPPRFV